MRRALRGHRQLVAGGRQRLFDVGLHHLELGYVPGFEALLHHLAETRGQVERFLRLPGLFLRREHAVKGLAGAAADLPPEDGDVGLGRLLLGLGHGDALAALAAELDGLVPGEAFVRRVARGGEADGGIRELARRSQTGQREGALLAGGAQLQVVDLGGLERGRQVERRALGGGQTARQDAAEHPSK